MTDETLFSRIAAGELPADIVYQDELVTAFRDISPRRPVHVLVVPNRVVPTADDVGEIGDAEAERLLGRLLTVARRVARDEGVADDGYRLVINCREHGRQEVAHLHLHLLGGADCGPMIGPVASADASTDASTDAGG